MKPVQGDSNGLKIDGVLGTNPFPNGEGAGVHGVSKNGGPGVLGESIKGRGVEGRSTNNYGVRAHSDEIAGIRASSNLARAVEGWGVKDVGVWGKSIEASGVHGISEGNKPGVSGESVEGRGVEGISTNNYGVRAHSDKIAGIRASSKLGRGVEGWGIQDDGVWGISTNATGVHGVSENRGTGVVGQSKLGRGVHGISETWQGVLGESTDQAGVVGTSEKFVGVWGETKSAGQPAVFGKGKLAARFEGDVEITGDCCFRHADLAEDFDVVSQTEPGEVMVLTETGILEPSGKAYDKKVVGVISGAGNYKPGIILDKQGDNQNRKPVAMMGKVYCKVDADVSSIEIGDMLTTSDIPGYAMKAIDPLRSFGAVIGKALTSLSKGKGLIPILVVLR